MGDRRRVPQVGQYSPLHHGGYAVAWLKRVHGTYAETHYLASRALRGSAVYRHGDRTPGWLSEGRQHRSLVCECEAVTAGEVQYAVENLTVNSLLDLRRRTRVGMGTCQGELCACRAAGLLQRFNVTTAAQSITQLSEFLNERWKGVQPVAWGDALRESEFTRWVYQGLCGLEKEHQDEI